LNNDKLFAVRQQAIKPRNPIEFAKMLKATAGFPALPVEYTVSLANFKPLCK
jgi:hypothetical protein